MGHTGNLQLRKRIRSWRGLEHFRRTLVEHIRVWGPIERRIRTDWESVRTEVD